jgi:aminodeoxychorismate lyase
MIVFLDGAFVPEEQALISVFDRSFLYGDGLFESIRVYNGRPFRWRQHLERLRLGGEFLKIRVPYPSKELTRFAGELIRQNEMREAILRLTLSRGVGVRGYSPKGADHPLLVMTLHPVPQIDPERALHYRLITASFRVPADDRLANHKTCNKLPQILARAEAEASGADEAILLNTEGEVAEAASSNLFWEGKNTVYTTPLASGILAGVTRELVIELCEAVRIPCRERRITLPELQSAEGVFLTTSTLEIVAVDGINGKSIRSSPVVDRLRAAYRESVKNETTG